MVRAILIMVVVLAGAGPAAKQEKPVLLTANGATNAKYSEYKNTPKAELKGAGYYAKPAMYGEKGTEKKLIPFGKGVLTNGDSTGAWKRKPGPYTYWQGKKEGEVFFEFGRPCRIRRVRVRLLFSKSSACGEIRLYAKAKTPPKTEAKPAEPKEPKPLATIAKPKQAWNEIKDLDVTTDGLRLAFKGVPKKHYIHVTEVEVWGIPPKAATAAAE